MFDLRANAECDLFETMNRPPDVADGKRLFVDLVNRSDAANLHGVETDAAFQKSLYQTTKFHEFPDKSATLYVPPPIVKEFPKRHSFVHNQIANKTKTNNEHMEMITNAKVLNGAKYSILQQLHDHSIEFRAMTAFKNALFDSELLTDNHLLPLKEWERLRVYETGRDLDEVNAIILEEIKLKGSNFVNLQKFMDLLDLFTLLPMTKTHTRNHSKDIYRILSSNTLTGHTVRNTDSGGTLKKMLDLLWIKLDERFKSMAEAYRYFDRNYNNRVSFGEFQKALDHLRIKFQVL